MPDLDRAVSARIDAITAQLDAALVMPDLDTPWEWHRELNDDW